jgi:CPA2 family monovalent cation:H+ antiporter-2
MLGYLVVGVLIGPNALALAQDSESVRLPGRVRRGVPDVRHRAGVQPAQAARHAQLVFGLGLSQVVLTMLGRWPARAAVLAALGWAALGDVGWQTALVLGGAMAMSSTAIVVKLMAERPSWKASTAAA